MLTLLPKIGPALSEPSKRDMLMYEVAAERGVDLALVIFILLIVFPVPERNIPCLLSRNVAVHTGIYSIFFLSDALVLFGAALLGFHVTLVFNVVSGGGFLSLLPRLVAAAQRAKAKKSASMCRNCAGRSPRPPIPNPGTTQGVMALNATLLKVFRKPDKAIIFRGFDILGDYL